VLTQAAVRKVVSRLGWLNVLNPLKVAHDYALNMANHDERLSKCVRLVALTSSPGSRVLIRVLLDLAAAEGGDNLKARGAAHPMRARSDGRMALRKMWGARCLSSTCTLP
jgi:hypothetical protein